MITRESALQLLYENVSSTSLQKHCLSVAIAMEAYAEKFNEDKDKWWICGLLHDFDYERFPSLEHHPFEGVKILKQNNYPEEIIEAILGHADYSGVPRKTLLAKSLFGVDELCGLILALAIVRPTKFDGMDAHSLKKAIKKKGFAAAINRDDIEKGAEELNINKEDHFNLVIDALRRHSHELGFN